MEILTNIYKLVDLFNKECNNLSKPFSKNSLKEILSLVIINNENSRKMRETIQLMSEECIKVLYEKVYDIITILTNKFQFFFLIYFLFLEIVGKNHLEI
jgi:hypothetical protein